MTSARWVRYWDRRAASYDDRMASAERRMFADSRPWIGARVHGATLELAVGTGLNLPHYPADIELTAAEHSPAMLAMARDRAERLGRSVRFVSADAADLPFGDASFDCVVCTFSLCCLADEHAALAEWARVLRRGGSLLLADHVAASSWWLRAAQHLVDVASVPLQGEHYTRRPIRHLPGLGLRIEESVRTHRGMIERVHARKPA